MSGATGGTKRQRTNNRSRVHDSVNRPRLRSISFVASLLRRVSVLERPIAVDRTLKNVSIENCMFFEPTVKRIREICATTAAQMQCPVHQRNARVEVEGHGFGPVDIEVFCCCEEFEGRVHRALERVNVNGARVSSDSEHQSGTAGQLS